MRWSSYSSVSVDEISAMNVLSECRQIELLLQQHASVTHQGVKKPFAEANLQLTDDTLEDIKSLKSDSEMHRWSCACFQFVAVLSRRSLVRRATPNPTPMRLSNQRRRSNIH